MQQKSLALKQAFVRRPDKWGTEEPPDPNPNPDRDIIVINFSDLFKKLYKNLC